MRHLMIACCLLWMLFGCSTDETTIEDDTPVIEYRDQDIVNQTIENFQFASVVTDDLILIHEINGVLLEYHSSHPDALSAEGIIIRGLIDVHVLMTVTFKYQTYETTIEYPLIVKGRTWTMVDIIEQDALQLNLDDEFVDSDLILPKTGTYGSVITWSSSHPHILSNQGRYYAPLFLEEVILTATLHYEGQLRTKTFNLSVKPISDGQKVDMAYEMLLIQTDISQDIVLSTRGYFGVAIQWQSSHPDIISNTGNYQKPVGKVIVTLTATLSSGAVQRDKTFELTIIGMDPETFIQDALWKLEINHGIGMLFESIVLPTRFMNHVHIEWTSSNEDIISHLGVLTLPNHTQEVLLTAYLSVSGFEAQKTFTYLMLGKDDTESEVAMQNLPERNLVLSKAFLVDSAADLSLGLFEGVMIKDDHLVLSGSLLEGSYTSPVYITKTFSKVNVMWGSITHPSARTQMRIRSLINGQWSPWTLMGDWGYGGENLPPSLTYVAPESSTHLQYKITLIRHSQFISSPRLHSVSLNYQWISDDLTYPKDDLPNHVFYNVPQLRQADTEDSSLWNNICWGTSVSMVLQHLGKLRHLDIPQAYYAPLIRQGTLQYGTTKNDIGATQFGIHVSVVEFQSIEMLLTLLYHHGPIIIGVSKGDSPTGKFGPLTFSSGHVIVVIGYTMRDDGGIDIILNDPAVSWIREPFVGDAHELMLVWDKGGVIMINPKSH